MEERHEAINYGYQNEYNQPSAIDSRINPSEILREVDRFLSGARVGIEQDENTGKYIQTYEQIIKPPMNETGRFFIMAKLSSIMNKANVQGNFQHNHYGDYMFRLHRSIAHSIMVNRNEWGIAEHYIKYIVDFIIQAVEPFFTRLKDDKERSHFDGNHRTVETNTIREPTSPFKFFGGQR